MHIQRASTRQLIGKDDFRIQRIRPGGPEGLNGDLAFGPLSVIDHAVLARGKTVAMHEHVNDEILSYVSHGAMVHEDSAGQRVEISPQRLMMMNAGAGFEHEESLPDAAVEMLQIFMRPRVGDLPAMVAFHDRPDGVPEESWGLIAGPEGSGAPLTIRNTVRLYDVRLRAGKEATVPTVEGLCPWLYVLAGAIEISGETLDKGDAVRDIDQTLSPIRALVDATLVLFLTDPVATGSRTGTISGR